MLPLAPTEARKLMLAKLATSGLDEQAAKALMMRPADPAELALAGLPRKAAFEIPYFDSDGKPTGFKRWRYLEETREGFELQSAAKPLRYVQLPDTNSELYLPPIYEDSWREIQSDVDQSIVITEGELKAAWACLNGFPCIGLGGVWSFKSKSRRLSLLPAFGAFKWQRRKVVIAYDSDAHTNHMVLAARNALCRELLALGAVPKIAQLTEAEDGSRRGLDDMGIQDGADAVCELLAAAEDYAPSAALHELNTEVAFITALSCIVVLDGGQLLSTYNFVKSNYANRHYSEFKEGPDGALKETKKPAAPAWLAWPARFELANIVYRPGEAAITGKREYNSWPGWGCAPKKGDISLWKKLLDHLFTGQAEERKWFERWCALPLQRPGTKMYTAAVLWGTRTGTGKTLAGATLGRIYGRNFTLIGDQQLQDSRNAWAINKQFVLGDDVTAHEQRKYADRLKSMITQEMMHIDQKYVPEYDIADCINYLFTSNHPDAFFLEDDDRRFFVHEVRDQPLPQEFYQKYERWMKGDGPSALFYHLLHMDLGNTGPADRAPATESKLAMIEDGLSDVGSWVRRLKSDPDVILRVGDAALTGDLWSARDLVRLYDPEGRGRVTAGGLGKEMKRAGVPQVTRGMQVKTKSGRTRLFAVRNPEKWAKATGTECASHYDKTRTSSGARPRRN